jgi:MFS family permease
MTSGAFSLSSIMNGLLTIPMGGLTDRFGPRMVMSLCGLLLGLGYILMSQISTVWQLYLFYGVIVGAGMAGSFIPLMSTVARWFFKKRSLMTGIVSAGIGLGALVGPKVAHRLISVHGWRASYVILGCVVSAVVVLSSQLIKRDPSQAGLVAYGGKQAGDEEWVSDAQGLSLKEALCAGPFWVYFGTGFCYGYCVFGIMVHIAPHAIVLGMPASRAANILATIGGMSIIGKVLLGRVGDLQGSRRTMMLGFALMSIALLFLVPAKIAWVIYLMAGLFGFSYGGCTVAHSPLIAVLFGLRSHGLILAVFGISVTIGGAVGPFLTGHIYDVTGGYKWALLVCAGISLSGVILTVILKEERVKHGRGH